MVRIHRGSHSPILSNTYHLVPFTIGFYSFWQYREDYGGFFMFMRSLLILSLAAFSSAGFGSIVSPLSFFQNIQGDYRILASGLKAPKGGTEVGYVAIEENEGLIVLPYCHEEGGVCDPGFRSFPLDKTSIKEEKMEPGTVRYTLETAENGDVRRYFWENRGQTTHFFDPDYSLVSGENFPLEFVIERIQ